MDDREYAEHRIQTARVNITRLESEIRYYEREIAEHEKTLRGDPEPGHEWCSQCDGTGLAGERESCFHCDGYGEVKVK